MGSIGSGGNMGSAGSLIPNIPRSNLRKVWITHSKIASLSHFIP